MKSPVTSFIFVNLPMSDIPSFGIVRNFRLDICLGYVDDTFAIMRKTLTPEISQN